MLKNPSQFPDRSLAPVQKLVLMLLTASCYFLFKYVASFGTDLHHDGYMMKPAFDVANGLVLYRDTYSHYGILPTWFQALAVSFFDVSVTTIRGNTVVFYILSLIVLFKISTRLFCFTGLLLVFLTYMALIPFGLYYFLPWSSVYAMFFTLLCAEMVLQSIEQTQRSKSILFAFAAGLSGMLILMCKQSIGIPCIIATGFALIVWEFKSQKSLSRGSSYLMGNLLCLGLFLVYFHATNSYQDWIDQTFTLPLTWAKSGGSSGRLFDWVRLKHALFPYPNPVAFHLRVSAFIWSLLPTINLIIFLVTLFYIFFRKRVAQTVYFLFVVSSVSIGAWSQYFPVSDVRHNYWAAISMFPLLVYSAIFISKFIFTRIPFITHSRFKHTYLLSIASLLVISVLFSDLKVRIEDLSARFVNPIYTLVTEPGLFKGMRVRSSRAQIAKKLNKESKKGRPFVLTDFYPLLTCYPPSLKTFHKVRIPLYMDFYTEYYPQLLKYVEDENPLILGRNTGKFGFTRIHSHLAEGFHLREIIKDIPSPQLTNIQVQLETPDEMGTQSRIPDNLKDILISAELSSLKGQIEKIEVFVDTFGMQTLHGWASFSRGWHAMQILVNDEVIAEKHQDLLNLKFEEYTERKKLQFRLTNSALFDNNFFKKIRFHIRHEDNSTSLFVKDLVLPDFISKLD